MSYTVAAEGGPADRECARKKWGDKMISLQGLRVNPGVFFACTALPLHMTHIT